MTVFNRRKLAKGIASSFAVTVLPPARANASIVSSSAQPSELSELSWTELLPGIWKATIGTPETHTPVNLRMTAPAIDGLRSLPAVAAPAIAHITGEVTKRGCTIMLPLKPKEKLYGFGLQLLSFGQRGKKKTIRVNADPKLDTGDSHAPVPFYVSTLGYGILIDSARHVDFYCGDARPKPTHPRPRQSGTVNTPEETESLSFGELSEVTVEVPHAAGVDIYLFGGPSTLNAVQRYNLFSGGGVVPPAWGLGFWYRAEGHGSQQSIASLARELRDRTIPCDVLGLEPGWHSHAYSCSFAWDATRFPNPQEFLKIVATWNYHVNLWEHAFTHPTSPLFESLLPHSGDFGVWGGLVPDFAGEPAMKTFGDYHGRALIDAGVSGFKLDECDGSDYTGGWSFPDMSRFPSGIDGEQMHGVFGLRYQHAIWQQFLDRKQPTYNLVRSSGALAAPYPFVLYSDLYDHRQFVRGLVNSGFSGLLWCPEVRDAKSEDDLLRRLQTAVFSPLAMVNAWYIKNPPWKQMDRKKNNADEFADNWQTLEARCREIIGWRMQLIPYLLSAFQRYAADGTPPFRALVLDDAEQPGLATIDDQYMIGDRMLVAPLFAGEPGRKITLPAGQWHDFWTGKAVEGGHTFSVPASYEKIPVYVKAGTVLPLAAIGLSASSPESRQLTVQVYGDGVLAWNLKEESGQQLALSWDASARKGKATRSGSDSSHFKIVSWKQMD